MSSDDDSTVTDIYEKIETAKEHEDRAQSLTDEAMNDLAEAVRSKVEFDCEVDVEYDEGEDYFTVEITPTVFKDVSEELSPEDRTTYIRNPLTLVVGREGANLDIGRERIKNLKTLIAELEMEYKEGAPVDVVLSKADRLGMDTSKAKHEIEKLKQQGEVYEPRNSHLRTT